MVSVLVFLLSSFSWANCEPSLTASSERALGPSEAAVVFFPRNTHFRLITGNRALIAVRNIADKGVNGAVIFFVSLTPEEHRDLKDAQIRSGCLSRSCSENVCRPLREAARMFLPRPLTYLPLTTAVSFWIRSLFGNRITHIEYRLKPDDALGTPRVLAAETAILGIAALFTWIGVI